MFRPRIIPCLLLKGRGLVKTIRFENPTYIGDPINAVRIFNDLETDELVFLDIDASKEKSGISLEFVKKVGEEAFMPFAVGGGIKTIEEIKQILNLGAEKVVINTYALENPDFIKEAAEIFGNQSIIVSIDAKKKGPKKYSAFGYGGTKDFEIDAAAVARRAANLGAGEILINSIDNDGTMEGYDLELIKKISRTVKIPVIAMGGARTLDDFAKAIYKGGAYAVAAGSIFVYGSKMRGILINYPEKEEIREIFK